MRPHCICSCREIFDALPDDSVDVVFDNFGARGTADKARDEGGRSAHRPMIRRLTLPPPPRDALVHLAEMRSDWRPESNLDVIWTRQVSPADRCVGLSTFGVQAMRTLRPGGVFLP